MHAQLTFLVHVHTIICILSSVTCNGILQSIIKSFQGNIFQSPISGTGKLLNTSTSSQSAITGITELAWNMTGHYQDRGRYLEELVFSVQQLPTSSRDVEYQWAVGYRAPTATTYASDVSYSIVMTTLLLPKEWVQVGITAECTHTNFHTDPHTHTHRFQLPLWLTVPSAKTTNFSFIAPTTDSENSSQTASLCIASHRWSITSLDCNKKFEKHPLHPSYQCVRVCKGV